MRAGAEIIALVVDAPERNAAMAVRWRLPFHIVSDPAGERFLRRLELWNEKERGGIALGALLAVSPAGEVLFRRTSRDFADRPTDDDVIGALEAGGFPALEPPLPPWQPETVPAVDPQGAFPVESFVPLMSGNLYGAFAILSRVEDPEARREIKAHADMARSFLDAWKELRGAGETRASGAGTGR